VTPRRKVLFSIEMTMVVRFWLTTGCDSSPDEIRIKYLHMSRPCSCIRALLLQSEFMRRHDVYKRTYAVVNPGCTGRSQILVDTVELDVGHEVCTVCSSLVVVKPTKRFAYIK
jgi:hypothetical protein